MIEIRSNNVYIHIYINWNVGLSFSVDSLSNALSPREREESEREGCVPLNEAHLFFSYLYIYNIYIYRKKKQQGEYLPPRPAVLSLYRAQAPTSIVNGNWSREGPLYFNCLCSWSRREEDSLNERELGSLREHAWGGSLRSCLGQDRKRESKKNVLAELAELRVSYSICIILL